MKTIIISFLLFYLAQDVLYAQPNLSQNEFYHIGDVIQMVKCSTDGVSAGAPGAGMNWDFSMISPSGGIATTTVLSDTSTIFLTSNLLMVLPNGNKAHVKENSTDTYINGITDVAGTTTYYDSYDISRRPFSYNTSYTDTYKIDVPTTPLTHGTGFIIQTADAYGTLKLPNGTFNNVMRIRKNQTETDTTGGVSKTTITTSYLWFDVAHNAPLFRLDSILNLSLLSSSQSAMYLVMPSAIKEPHNQVSRVSGYLNNTALTLTGNFEYNKRYEVVLYNIIGSKMLSDEFMASGKSMRFETAKQIIPGIYMVSIMQKNNPSSKEVIKLVKQ